MRSVLWSSMLWSVLLGFPALAQTTADAAAGSTPKAKTPRLSAAAREALGETARQLTAQLEGLKGEERRSALRAGAERFAELARRFAAEPAAATRAHYQCAEQWRRHGSLDLAKTAYDQALQTDQGAFRERALFGKAEMQRRLEEYDAAIATYRSAAKVQPDSNRAHSSRLWIARCLARKGDADAALTAFRSALESAARPRQVIDACNQLANALIKRGDLDGAAAAVEHADAHCRADIEAKAPDGENLQRALDRMSARRALQRARDKQNGAAQDAVRLEADRGRRER